LQIEGWRGLPHSYAIANQFQCLEFLQMPGVALRHVDLPYFNRNWKRVSGLFPPAAEAEIASIPAPAAREIPDAVYRMNFPYDLSPSTARRTAVFGTAEFRCVPPSFMAGNRPLADACADGDAIIITCSNWSREGFIQSGVPAERVHLVPLGVDPTLFHPVEAWQREQFRSQMNWTGFVFLTLGSMTGNKGVVPLFKAFAIVAQKHPHVKLVAKGMGALYPSMQFLKSQINGLTQAEMAIIQPRLVYLENTLSFTEMARLYQSADAYVSPYSAEGFNLPVLESIASGLPVICTAGGSTDDFTSPEFALRINSRVVNVRPRSDTNGFALQLDFNHLVHLMLTAVENPALAASARIHGPEFVVKNGFSWRQVASSLASVLLD
jgi:glycosyltransferase involved in cell wall biosynthesis